MQIATILNRYRFETRGYSAQELLDRWLPNYSLEWIRMAVLEALYQGRYKVISVEEILKIWQRKGQPMYHFTHDFERLVCKNLPGGAMETRAPVEPSPRVSRSGDRNRKKSLEPAVDTLSALEINAFDDPRQTMSDVGELFSRLSVEPATVAKKNGGSGNGNGRERETVSNENNGDNGSARHSIDEFIPLLDGSELYSKLKAVARSNRGERLT